GVTGKGCRDWARYAYGWVWLWSPSEAAAPPAAGGLERRREAANATRSEPVLARTSAPERLGAVRPGQRDRRNPERPHSTPVRPSPPEPQCCPRWRRVQDSS